jgi:hypothetical protein
MKRFEKGDRVRYRGKTYYIVGDPSAYEMTYELSEVPPSIRAPESEIELDEGLPESSGLAIDR